MISPYLLKKVFYLIYFFYQNVFIYFGHYTIRKLWSLNGHGSATEDSQFLQ